MGKREKKAYLEAIRERYRTASKQEKRLILNEFCSVCGYHRKHAIRLLRKRRKPLTKGPIGRKPQYNTPEFLDCLKQLWLATDQMGSKTFKAALPLWLPFYDCPDSVREQLLKISPATMDRRLLPIRRKAGKGRCATRPGTLLKTQIPIRTNHWDVTKPGFFEADTVAHCGNSLSGDFVYSLNLTDIQTTWTECRCVWNKGATGVVEQIKDIEAILPFRLRGFDCDNGSEFINHHLVEFFRGKPVQFTRSRPYKTNDNAHVEQKNWTHVRQLFGYDRIDNPALVPLMNDLYKNEWALLMNHFHPTRKLINKIRFGSRYKKVYDQLKTPFQRVIDSTDVAVIQKLRLQSIHDSLNPFQLNVCIQRKIKAIFQQVSVTSNVRLRI